MAVGSGTLGALVVFLIVFGVVVGSIAMLVVALVDIVRRPDWQWRLAGQEKVLWLLLVVLADFLAVTSLVYWFVIRKKLAAVEAAAAAGQLGAGCMTFTGWQPSLSPRTPSSLWDGTPIPAGSTVFAGGTAPAGRTKSGAIRRRGRHPGRSPTSRTRSNQPVDDEPRLRRSDRCPWCPNAARRSGRCADALRR